MAELRRITTYPIKALDPFDRETGQITEEGVIEDDREYAILDRSADESYDPDTASVSGNGDYINGKRTAAVHRLRSTFDPEARTLMIRIQDETDAHTFDLDDRTELNAWLTDYFGRPVSVRRDASGHHDLRKRDISGPSVISTATLREVASWFPEIEIDSIRRRFRANLEIGGVPHSGRTGLLPTTVRLLPFASVMCDSKASNRANGVLFRYAIPTPEKRTTTFGRRS
ncbi:MOSC N-terminal beta barrel domain-containing protein [Halocatena marina]|uniref:MOSC N-terminal beta barrel domain-containing protein n=1 Tax=Halocatena marina TaxID=2934937 RepID=A0ABD5YR49_9EURY